ncbi:MAG: hypothetical protein APF82_09395 [Sphingomonadales bacterium BRH_c42]|nr:MAG: hypothetical protein APF82_09395 [Sphingomonadales bacterium BRH_c42]
MFSPDRVGPQGAGEADEWVFVTGVQVNIRLIEIATIRRRNAHDLRIPAILHRGHCKLHPVTTRRTG